MKIIVDCKNKNLPKCQFEAIKKMFDGLFKEFSFEFINYKIVNDVIEDYANTQFFMMAMAENLKEIEL